MITCSGMSCSFGLSWAFVKFCVCPSFPFCIDGSGFKGDFKYENTGSKAKN